MSKTITRQLLKLFGGNGDSANFGQFGSKTADAPVHTKDIPTIQALDAWINGWQEAVVNSSKAPFLEDMNSAFYVAMYQLFYLLQEGIAEWDSNTTYYIGSTVRRPGTALMYQSLIDGNLNNALPGSSTVPASDGNWQVLTQSGLATGIIVPYANSPAPNGWLFCRGDAVSRTAYPALFANLGTLWGPGDGTTTFNLPDLQGRTLFGFHSGTPPFDIIGNASYGGANSHSHSQAAHNHSIPALSLNHSTLSGSTPFTVTSDQYSEAGGQMGINPTPSGIGAVDKWFNIWASTIATVTGNAQPPIDPAANLPTFAVINYIIKT